MMLITKSSDQTRQRGPYLYKPYLSPEYLVLPLLLPCYSQDYLGWQLLGQPFLFYIFSSFLPIYSGRQVCWKYQPGSHRRKVTQGLSSTFLLRRYFSREKDSAVPFPRRP